MNTDELRRTLVRAAKHRCAELGRPFTAETRRAVEEAIDRYRQAIAAEPKDYERCS